MLVSPGAGFGSGQDKGWASVFPMEFICSLPRSEPVARPWEGRAGAVTQTLAWPTWGLCALCPLASLSVVASPHPFSPSRRLYLSLVLGNVNVTLLSKQAK